MLEKFLNDYVSIVAGSGADKIVSILFKKKNVNEFLIAKKLNMTINQTRNILYKLADKGLVYFMRKKDLKSGGWYTYFWTLDDYKCLVSYQATLLREIEHQEATLLTRKTKQFYVCKTCGVEVVEEQAILHDFTCSECGEVYISKDPTESVKEVEKSIQKLRDKAAQMQVVIDELALLRVPKVVKKAGLVKKGKKGVKGKSSKRSVGKFKLKKKAIKKSVKKSSKKRSFGKRKK